MVRNFAFPTFCGARKWQNYVARVSFKMHHPVAKLTSHINMTKGKKNVSPSKKRWVHDNHHRKVKELTNPTCQLARSDQLVQLNPSTKIQVGRTTLLQPPAQTVKVVTVGRVNSRWSGKMSKTWTQNLSLRLLPITNGKAEPRTTITATGNRSVREYPLRSPAESRLGAV